MLKNKKNNEKFTRGDIVHVIVKSPATNLFSMNYMVYLGLSQKEKGMVELAYYGTNITESVFKNRVFVAEDTNKAFKRMQKLIREFK